MTCRSLSLSLFACMTGLPLASQTPPGACAVDDAAFTTRQGGCQDQASNLVWSSRFVGTVNWANATTWCGNLVEGGFSDWRVPTLAELQAVDATGAATHLNNITVNGQPFWSSTAKGNKAWSYAFGTNASGLYPKTSLFFLYCVRQGTPAGMALLAGDADLPHLRAVQTLDDNVWTTTVLAPELAQQACFFVTGMAGGSDLAIPQTVPGRIDAGAGMLNAGGRVSLAVDLGTVGLGLPVMQSLEVGLVVMQAAGPVMYDLSAAR